MTTQNPNRDAQAWHFGYADEIYCEFGDHDGDAYRAERAFGC